MNGKHIFVEKPLALNHYEAVELNLLAESLGRTLLVDNTFLYTPQINKIKEIIKNNNIGKIVYYNSVRASLGNICKDVNVTYDLAVHDIAILLYLLDEFPVSVSAVGNNFIDENIFCGANINLFYKNGFYANIKVDWNFPTKTRDIIIGGSEKFLKYSDNLSYDDRLVSYDSKFFFNDDRNIEYKRGKEEKIKVDNKDAISEAIKDFIYCCKNNHQPISNGLLSCNTIYILEKINQSINKKGMEVIL